MSVPRHWLPQIPSDQVDNFIQFLRGHDIRVRLVKISVNQLKPVQSEVNKDKIEKMKKDEHLLANPIIVSKGGFVLDGHHRWLAAKELDPDGNILAYVCECSIRKLVELGHEFDGSFTKTVYESTIYDIDRDYDPEMHNPDDSEELMVRKTLRPAI